VIKWNPAPENASGTIHSTNAWLARLAQPEVPLTECESLEIDKGGDFEVLSLA
jgi:hypothetical protein